MFSSHSSLNVNGGCDGGDPDKRMSGLSDAAVSVYSAGTTTSVGSAGNGASGGGGQTEVSALDLSGTVADPTSADGGKLVAVVVGGGGASIRIGTVSVCGKSGWDLLDSLVHRLFQVG